MPKVLALISVVALSLLLAASAQAARGMESAIEDEDIFVTGKSLVSAQEGYQFLRQLGIKRQRILIGSSSVKTGTGYDFSVYQAAIQQSLANGVKVQVSLLGPANKPKVPEFARFATAAAQAFKGNVDRYSIWNEPNLVDRLKPVRTAPTQYRKLYAAGYKAIKKADPKAKVWIGETSPYVSSKRRGRNPVAFLRELACVNARYRVVKRCTKLKADGYAHHPYDFQSAPAKSNRGADAATVGTLSNLTRALTKLQRSRQITGTRNIYLTEFGYLATTRRRVSESLRAKYTTQAFTLARRTPRIRQMLQYLLAQPTSTSSPFTTGVLTRNGQPLPVFNALVRFAK